MRFGHARAAGVIGAAAMALQPSAALAQKPCIIEREVGALVIFLAPPLIEAVRERCGTQLAADGFLAREGEALSARYAERRAVTWPDARAAFLKFADAGDGSESDDFELLANLPDKTLQPMMEEAIVGKVLSMIKPQSCGGVERVLTSLAPIEPNVVANLIGVVAGVAGLDEPAICPAEQA